MIQPPTPDEILLLARLADLPIPPEGVDELVEIYGHVHAMVARLPANRPMTDEPAHIFDPARFLPTPAKA